MKKSFIRFSLLFAVVATVGIWSCEKSENENVKPDGGHSGEEYVAPPVFNIKDIALASGSKVYANQNGVWWQDGDGLVVNGHLYEIKRESGEWKAVIQDNGGQVYPGAPDGRSFNFLYVGSVGNATWPTYIDETGDYEHVSFANPADENGSCLFALTSRTDNNDVTLWPCCAVLLYDYDFADDESAWVEVEYADDTENYLVEAGTEVTVNCGDHRIEPSGNTSDVATFYGKTKENYIVLPMEGDEVKLKKLTLYTSNATDGKPSRENLTIVLKKGVVYRVAFQG